MKFVKLSFIILIILITTVARAQTQTQTQTQTSPVIGYGYSTSVLPEKNQESFVSGFAIGFKKILGEEMYDKLVVLERDTSGTSMSALKALNALISKNTSMIVGFPTSHEALQVASSTNKTKLLTLFPAASHSKLAEFGSNIVTTGESMNAYVKQTVEFLANKYPKGKCLFVYNPRAVFSVDQKEAFYNFYQKKNEINQTEMFFVALNRDLQLPVEHINALKEKKYDFVFLSMYPDESYQLVVKQFPENNIDLPIITNSSWVTGDIESIRRGLSEKKSLILTGTTWVPGSTNSIVFEQLVKQQLGIESKADIASGYDVGIIAATIINRANGDHSKEGLLKAFNKNRCFDGLTIGKICFPASGGHGDAELKFVYLTKQGLQKIEK